MASTKRARPENVDAGGSNKRSRPSLTNDEGAYAKAIHPPHKVIRDAAEMMEERLRDKIDQVLLKLAGNLNEWMADLKRDLKKMRQQFQKSVDDGFSD